MSAFSGAEKSGWRDGKTQDSISRVGVSPLFLNKQVPVKLANKYRHIRRVYWELFME